MLHPTPSFDFGCIRQPGLEQGRSGDNARRSSDHDANAGGYAGSGSDDASPCRDHASTCCNDTSAG